MSSFVKLNGYDVKDAEARNSIDTLNNTTIPTINERIETLEQTTIPSLDERLDILETKKDMIIIGDSYSSRSYLDSAYKLWHTIVGEVLNLNVHNYADPGAGFLNQGDERHSTFITQITEASNDTSFDNSNVEYVFCLGGLNDLRYYSSNNIALYGQAYNQFCITARNTFPKAKIIYLGCNTFGTFQTKVLSDNQTVTELWVDNYIKNCDQAKNKQISFLDMTLFWIGMNDTYFVGGVGSHPNYVAHRDLAQAIINGLTSSQNAFEHLISDIPSINSQSSSIWSTGNSVVGENIYQLRVTNNDVKLYLQTALTRNDLTSTNCIVNLPFNMIIPYAQMDKSYFTPQNNVGYYYWFIDTHSTAGCEGTGILPMINNLGYQYMNVYCRWIDQTFKTIDLTYKIEFNL